MQLPSADTWPTNWQNHSSLFGRGTASTADGYSLVLGATKLIFQSSDTAVLSGTHGITVGNWYHVAVSRTSGTLQLFVNGLSIASVSYTGTPGAGANFYIGSETGQGAYFYGYMSNVRLVKGTGLYTTTFTPSSTPLQPIAGTQVLTNQTQSFNDMSPNNGVVIATNSPSVQKYSPFSGTTLPTPYYSAYFDGSEDMITVPSNSVFVIGTNNCTIEAWAYVIGPGSETGSSGYGLIWGKTSLNDGINWYNELLLIEVTNKKVIFKANTQDGNAQYEVATPANSINLNTWHHIAFTKVGTQWNIYIDGILKVSEAKQHFGTVANYFVSIGRNANPSSLKYAFNGCISNVRVINGTALYTENFTPSTQPLTAISGTSLLTCQSNTFVDNSTNNFAVTAAGNSKPTTFAPFAVTYSSRQSYTPAVFGGSMYFDGTGDYLNSSNSAFAMGTGSFTWEAWIYCTGNFAGYRQIFSTRTTNGSSTAQGSLALVPNTQVLTWYTGSAIITTSATVPINAWSHVAIVRNGTAMTLYLNGISVGTATNSDNLTASVFSIGANNDGSEPFMGYISDVRVIKNQALYTSNFVPQNNPLTAVKNTILLLNGTGAGIYDSSENAVFETVGDSKLSTSTVKFAGTTSVYFDGTGDYLAAPPPPSCMSGELGTGDFTIEYWMNASAAGTYVTVVGTQSVAGNSTAGIWRAGNRFNGANGIYFNYTNGGSFIDLTFSTTNYNDGAWHHVAFVRSSGSLKAYVDGTQVGSAQSVTQSLSSNQRMYVGYNVQDNAYYTGYISDLRITKGFARYTTNFTAPTIPFSTK